MTIAMFCDSCIRLTRVLVIRFRLIRYPSIIRFVKDKSNMNEPRVNG